MRKIGMVACLMLGFMMSAKAQVEVTDSVAQSVDVLDSAKVVADTTLLAVEAVTDSLLIASDSLQAVPDSLAQEQGIAADSVAVPLSGSLLDLGVQEVDSTALIMERIKALTDSISDKSILNAQKVKEIFSDTAIVNKYSRQLKRLVRDYERELEFVSGDDSIHFNSYYFRLFAPLTLYRTPVSSAMRLDTAAVLTPEDSLLLTTMSSGRDLRLASELDRVLLGTYLTSPALVVMTEDKLRENRTVSEETMKNTANNVKLDVATTVVSPLASTDKATITTNMEVLKPNFWKTKGSFSMQFTESYFSENWYQGGTNNLNMLSTMSLEANYDNKRKMQWYNKLDARIGFYQNEGAEIQSNQDLLRATSKLNLKAIYNWNYTVEAQGNTQMMQHFESDKVTLKTRFLAPVDATLTIGMDYRKNFKKGSISVFPGPLSYKITYVAVPEVAKRYNFEDGKSFRDDIGSKLEVNFNYQLAKGLNYVTRFYYYTGRYEYVQMDWENTFNFQMNKHLSAKFFFHVRYDDNRDPHEEYGYLQFKEYLTFGLNYSW